MSRRLLLGTRNPGKVKEITTILAGSGWSFSSLQDFAEVGPAAEDGVTYAENAIAKAQFYAAATGLWALADDSGLEVAALGGAPGVFSARYAGENASDADRRQLLLSELAKVNTLDRRAQFVAAVAIAKPDGAVLNVTEGICEGTIAFEPRGAGGFGYDPLFIPDGYNQTFAELTDDIKNRISHRGRALMRTRDSLDHLDPAS
ncbi:MAG TPA: RdgB/HAM1 family non-canonical purine NTP pyrophosphatase [Pyrinomonadaceae bacterium]|jgi:XTP/dITP diphosphohydrolase|nr:RdgB/HAM1 family non-canonical purine NTP pyrophosphatase [Pyrinomonadaceae bacterium]